VGLRVDFCRFGLREGGLLFLWACELLRRGLYLEIGFWEILSPGFVILDLVESDLLMNLTDNRDA
jgi:hypothetical protein